VPPFAPPPRYDGTPHRYRLGRGTCLWRVHGRRYSARSFKNVPSSSLFDGARFDATPDDLYPFYYAALDEGTALAETLFRDLPPDEYGKRVLARPALTERQISGLTLTRDLELVSLINGKDLAAIGADSWLVTASGAEYAQTRGWGHWLRAQTPWACGFVWDSLRDRQGTAIVLFGDRLAASFGTGYERSLLHEVPELAVDLDDPGAVDWLNALLEAYRVTIEPPRSGGAGR
jgi:hypothetical protein